MRNGILAACVVLVSITGMGCATYYQQNLAFQEHFVSGEIEQAHKVLNKNRKAARGRNRLLYFLQKGVVLQMLGAYEESNKYLEKAYIYAEDYRRNPARVAASLLTNPTVKAYTGEDHERVLIHYYKAMNFLMMNQYESALVECRRLNNKLTYMNDRYEKRKNRYKQDAFALNLMGLIYEASGDINNAFIAYRNAYRIYKEDYREHFDTEIPEQLKQDLLRTAYLNGFDEELYRFEQEFNTDYKYKPREGGELVFFWQNGLGPIKDEWSINFVTVKGESGGIIFVNEEYGLNFSFSSYNRGRENGTLKDLKFVRVAFPKYRERRPYFRSAEIMVGNRSYKLELAENVNEIAIQTLEDRMLREMANSLLRLAIKQAAEKKARDKDKHLGALISAINAATEKADTRNWQTLPYSISYARVPLKVGKNQVKLITHSTRDDRKVETFEFHVQKGETVFHNFHSLDSMPLRLN